MVERRSPKPEVAGSIPVAPAIVLEINMLKNNKIYKFYQQVRQEATRVSWPSRKDVMTAVGVIFLVMVIFSLLCLLIDYSSHGVVQFILNIGKK